MIDNLEVCIYPSLRRSPEEKILISLLATHVNYYLEAKVIVGKWIDHPDFKFNRVVFDNEWTYLKIKYGREARNWLFDPTIDSEFCINGFVSICRLIGIDPGRARLKLLAIDRNDIPGIRERATNIKDRRIYFKERKDEKTTINNLDSFNDFSCSGRQERQDP